MSNILFILWELGIWYAGLVSSHGLGRPVGVGDKGWEQEGMDQIVAGILAQISILDYWVIILREGNLC